MNMKNCGSQRVAELAFLKAPVHILEQFRKWNPYMVSFRALKNDPFFFHGNGSDLETKDWESVPQRR